MREEQKVAALVTGSSICEAPHGRHEGLRQLRRLRRGLLRPGEEPGPEARDPRRQEGAGAGELCSARRPVRAPGLHVDRVPHLRYRLGFEAYLTVSGQNSNDTVRVTDDFLRAVENDDKWELTNRIGGKVGRRCRPATCGRVSATPPGPRPIPACSTTPPSTTGTPASADGEIRASNPCSEYMFLDDTACNLASLNLLAFDRIGDRQSATQSNAAEPSPTADATADCRLDFQAYEHAVRLWTVVLEISVTMAQFPSREIAQLSYEYRTLGLGYANIGGLLMTSGIPV